MNAVSIAPIGRVPRPTRFFTDSGSLSNAGWQAIRAAKALDINADELTIDDASRFVSQQLAAIRIVEHDDADITPEVVRRERPVAKATKSAPVSAFSEMEWDLAEDWVEPVIVAAPVVVVEVPVAIEALVAAIVDEIVEAIVEAPKSSAKAPPPKFGKYANAEVTARPKETASCAVVVQAAPAPKPAPALTANQARDAFGLRRR